MPTGALRWRVNDTVASDESDGLPVNVPGDTVTVTLAFRPRPDEPRNAYRDRFDRVRDLLPAADYYDVYETDETALYVDHVSGPSPLVRLEALGPAADSVMAGGVWGLIAGGEDASRAPRAVLKLDLELEVLAGLDEHASRGAAREVHEANAI